MGLNERQVKAVLYIKAHGKMTNSEYQSFTGVTKRTTSRDLEALVQSRLLERIGETGKGTHYILKGHREDKRVTK
jgi:ATP-dependent DNA helicase RecG